MEREDPPVSRETQQERVVPFSRRRQAIARRLTLSAQTIPHCYLCLDVDMSEAEAWRETLNHRPHEHISVTDVVAKATALSLQRFPHLNAHVSEEALTLKPDVNLGIAVATEGGLLVPVIADCARLSLQAVAQCSRRNAEAAREGRITAGPAGTFTLSSLGMYGIRQFLPIINPPECAILAVGAVERRLVSVGERIAARQMMSLTLACDHRAVDGAEAAQFLTDLKARLEEAPAALAEGEVEEGCC